MKAISRFILLALSIFNTDLFGAPNDDAESGVFQSPSFEVACQQAAANSKYVFIDFYTTWCAPCKMLDREVFHDPATIALLAEKTIAIKVDAEQQGELAQRYRVNSFPTLLLLKADGTELERLIGYSGKSSTIEAIGLAITTGIDSVTRMRQAIAAAAFLPAKRAGLQCQLARLLIARGENEPALNELLSVYELSGNLPTDQRTRTRWSVFNIFSTFSKLYTPAKAALEKVRDATQTEIEQAFAAEKKTEEPPSSIAATVADYVAANHALQEDDKSIAFFSAIPRGHKLRLFFADELFADLVAAQRYTDAVEGRSYESITTSMTQRLRGMTVVWSKDSGKIGAEVSPEMQREHFKNQRRADYFEALVGAGRLDEAKRFATEFFGTMTESERQKLLHPHAERAGHPDLL